MAYEMEIAAWWAENYQFGRSLGYPDCCVSAFCNDAPAVLQSRAATQADRDRYTAGCVDGVFTGFIPCVTHAGMILRGHISLHSLISNRNLDFKPFPNEWGI